MWHCLFYEGETSEWHMVASPTLLYHTGIQCQNNLRGNPSEICIAYCTHIYMHGNTTLALLSTSLSKMLCRAAAGVGAHVTRDVSHSIPTAGTGDSPRGQKWAKDRNSTPIQISCATTSTASVIHSSCDTAAMYRGGFLRNGTVELESSKILLESALMKTLRPTWIVLKIIQV